MPEHSDIGSFRASADRIRFEFDAKSTRSSDLLSPKLATPLARTILSGFAEAVGLQTSNFLPTGSHAAGGLSRIWGALAMPWDPADLASFPDREGLLEGYDHVASRIGLSRPGENGAALTAPAQHILSRHRDIASERGFALEPASNAVLTDGKADRQACNACGLCLYGCSRGAIYHSALELSQLRSFRNFTYRSGIRVQRLASESELHVVEAVSPTGPIRLSARRIILAAGTIATTSLAFRRLGLVGKPVPLQSNPVGGAAFLVLHMIGRDLPRQSFGLGQLFYRSALRNGTEAIGVLYGADTLPLASLAEQMPLRRKASTDLARALAPGLLLASSYLPGRYSQNHIIVEEDGGDGRVSIIGTQTSEAAQLLRESFRRISGAMRRRGAWQLPGSATVLQPGADAHAGATLPMGADGPNGTGSFGELRGIDGIFVVDGACLPTLSAIHSTLTIMANADRIGRQVAHQIVKERTVIRPREEGLA